MATRLYFSATANTSGLTPVITAGWDYVSEGLRRDLLKAKSASESLTIGNRIGPWADTAGTAAIDRQYISPPLAAQTISGTFSGQVMVREYAGTDNVDRLVVGIRVVNSAGTPVANVFTLSNATTTAEFVNNVTHRNKGIADGDALTSYSCAAGDRLVVEIGYVNSTAGTSPEASAKWGAPDSVSDLPVNETQTTDGVGWIEFSANLAWLYTAPVSGGVVLAGAATLARTFAKSGSGGVTLSGAATIARVFTPSSSGGLTLAGSATIARTFAASVSSGISLAGTAPVATTRAVTSTGGVTLSGAAEVARTFTIAPVGGLALGGAASTSYVPAAGSTVYTYSPTGGITLSGSAATQYATTALPQSGSAGTRTTVRRRQYTTRLSRPSKKFEYVASGSLSLSGTAEVSALLLNSYAVSASGGLRLGGYATISRTIAHRPMGGTKLGGTAEAWMFSPTQDEIEALTLLAMGA